GSGRNPRCSGGWSAPGRPTTPPKRAAGRQSDRRVLHAAEPGLVDDNTILRLHGGGREVVEGPQALVGEGGAAGKADNGEGRAGDEQRARHDSSPLGDIRHHPARALNTYNNFT